jgi:hypothetical protein
VSVERSGLAPPIDPIGELTIAPIEDEDGLPDEASRSLRRRGEVGTTSTKTIIHPLLRSYVAR